MSYEEISASRRRPKRTGRAKRGLKPGSIAHRLIIGQTLLMSYPPSGYAKQLATYGLRLVTRRDSDGFVVWTRVLPGKKRGEPKVRPLG